MRKVCLALMIAAVFCGRDWAADLYWDSDGATAGGSASTTAAGTWGTNTFWTSDSSGSSATGAWVAGSKAIFSAGTDVTGSYNVTILASTTQDVTGGLEIQEGNVSLVQSSSSAINIGAGTVTIDAGAQLRLNAISTITHTSGGGGVVINGGTLENINTGNGGSFYTSTANISIGASGATLRYNTSNFLNILLTTTAVSGSGSFTKTGVGALAIAGPGTWTGGTFVNEGELRIRTTADRLPTGGAVTVSSPGVLNLNGVSQRIASLTGTGNVGTGSGTLTINGSTSTTFDGALKNLANAGAGAVGSGNGRLVKDGASTITFNGLNDINGSVTLTAGGITVNASGSLCGDIADVAVNGGTLTLNEAAETIENLSGTGGTINLNNASLNLISDPIASTSYAGTITGTGGLTRKNANATTRTLTLTGANNYTGVTTVEKGIIAVGNATALGSAAGNTVVQSGGEILFTGQTLTVAENFNLAGVGAGDNGAIAVQGTSTVTLSGAVTLAADTQLTVAGNSTVTYSNATAITSNSNQNLTLQGGSPSTGSGGTISGLINLGAGSLTKLQGGNWTLSNAVGNSYSGGTFIGNSTITTSAGSLTVTNTSGSGTGSGNITIGNGASSGTLNVGDGGAGGSVSGDIAFNNTSNSSTVNFNRTVDLTHAGAISGANGAVNKLNTNILTLTAANTYSGNTTVSGGTLLANNATGSATGTGNVTVGNTATLGGTGSVSGSVTVQSGGTLSPGNSIESLGSGAVTFSTGSTFKYEINTLAAVAAGADLLNATGSSLSIASGVSLLALDLNPNPNAISGPTYKYTMIAYSNGGNANYDPGTFAGYGELSVVTFTPGGKQFRIRYRDTAPGNNFAGELTTGGNNRFVTLTAVPELGSFITMGLVGCCAIGAVRFGRRFGLKALCL